MVVVPLVILWGLLLYHLSTRWEAYEQYSYGWTVPLLCLGMLWNRWRFIQKEPVAASNSSPAAGVAQWQKIALTILFCALVLLYLPTRLLQVELEFTRSVDWLLSIEVVGITLLALYAWQGKDWLRHLAFPICFILVAVPWPGVIERPIVQGLALVDAHLAVESVGAFGIPAILHGRTIEIGNGVVGVNDACSGIRSFQSSIMVALCLGEMFRFTWGRRLILLGAGVLLSFLLNVVRTAFLVMVASRDGISAVSTWHDSAGLSILACCLVGLYVLAHLLSRKQAHVQSVVLAELSLGRPEWRLFKRLSLGLLVWLVLVEVSCLSWARFTASKTANAQAWTVNWPQTNSTFKMVQTDAVTKATLGCDRIQQAEWLEDDGSRWQVFLIEWLPSRLSRLLARNHSPEVCLKAVGFELVGEPVTDNLMVHGREMPFRHYTFRAGNGLMHVYFNNWEFGGGSGGGSGDFFRGATGSGSGQQVLEVAVTGLDNSEVREAVIQQLERLINDTTKGAATNSPALGDTNSIATRP